MNEWTKQFAQAFEQPLPGWDAQSKMINYDRPPVDDISKVDPGARLGAVLVLIYPKESVLHTVLTLRNVYRGTHSGQVSFPGGKVEPGDENLWATALREAQEEVNLLPENVQYIGQLSQIYIPPSRFLVSPYLAVTNETPQFTPDPTEVARIIEAPIADFLDLKNIAEKDIFVETLKAKMKVKYFAISGETVWGATAMILSELAEMARRYDWPLVVSD